MVGAGGLGCPALLSLAPYVRLTIVDPDRVDVSNLHRQILYRTRDLGRLKVDCAREQLLHRLPTAMVTPLHARIDSSNGLELIAGHDLVVDGSDSFATKFLLNDLCLQLGTPLVHGAVVGWTGHIMTVVRGHACYRCIFEAPPQAPAATSCQENGVVGAACGVIGAWMAREALATLRNQPSLAGTLLVFDTRTGTSRQVKPRRRLSCPAHAAAEVATW
jgi:molybdopterin-synthase adenylyltransferase